ncbi:hypothetical protein VTO73DRAFT_6917 [Trametes versicolor]
MSAQTAQIRYEDDDQASVEATPAAATSPDTAL